jgi:hypothetical protein
VAHARNLTPVEDAVGGRVPEDESLVGEPVVAFVLGLGPRDDGIAERLEVEEIPLYRVERD